jgi:hypothetical protein
MQAALNTVLKHHGMLIDRSDVTSGGEKLIRLTQVIEGIPDDSI